MPFIYWRAGHQGSLVIIHIVAKVVFNELIVFRFGYDNYVFVPLARDDNSFKIMHRRVAVLFEVVPHTAIVYGYHAHRLLILVGNCTGFCAFCQGCLLFYAYSVHYGAESISRERGNPCHL